MPAFRAGTRTRPTTSLAKAHTSRLRAAASGMPRERPVRLAFSPLGGELLLKVVAREPPAEGERVGPEAAGPALDDGGEAHVERRLALPLDPVVLEPGAILEHDLRHRVGEVRRAGYAGVALHDL